MKKSLYIFIWLLFLSCMRPTHESYNIIEDVGEWFFAKDSIRRDSNGVYRFIVYRTEGDNTIEEYGSQWDGYNDIDISSFKICKDTGYAKDSRRVYYWVDCVGLELQKGRYRRNPGELNFKTMAIIVKDCSPYTFKYIGNGYGIDYNHMYYNGFEIPWNDSVIQNCLLNRNDNKY